MAAFRVVFIFKDINGGSWTEDYYRDAANLDAAAALAGGFLTARRKFLHPVNTFIGMRVSDLTASRATKQININLPGLSGGAGGPADPEDSIILSLTATGGGKRKLWMRGNARSDFVRNESNGRAEPPAAFLANLADYLVALNGASFGIRRLTPLASRTPNHFVTVQKVSPTAGDNTLVTLDTPDSGPFAVDPKRLIAYRFSKKDLPALSGHFDVISAPTTTTLVIPYRMTSTVDVLTPGARIAREQYDAVHIFDVAGSGFFGYGSHDTRNPIIGSRGARRAQRIRLLP